LILALPVPPLVFMAWPDVAAAVTWVRRGTSGLALLGMVPAALLALHRSDETGFTTSREKHHAASPASLTLHGTQVSF